MNLCMEQKQIHGRGERTCGCQGGGEGAGWTGVGGEQMQTTAFGVDKQCYPAV